MFLPGMELPIRWERLMERGRQACFRQEDFRLQNIHKDFREIPGSQSHIWLRWKVMNMWGNVLDGVSILDGVVGAEQPGPPTSLFSG